MNNIAIMLNELLECYPRGVFFCDWEGKILYKNPAAQALNLSELSEVIEKSKALRLFSFDIHQEQNSPFHVEIYTLSQGYCVIADPELAKFNVREKLLKILIFSQGENLFDRAATAIGKALNWRWVAVSRFLPDHRAKVISWWVNGVIEEGFDYELLGTPCELLVKSKNFCYIPNVTERFATEPALKKLGAKVYAGIVYRVNKEAVGHIFAMTDEANDEDLSVVEDIIRLTAGYLGSKLELEIVNKKLEFAENSANTDVLTGLGNRRAFDRDIHCSAELFHNGILSDSLLAIIDLDGMKHINDHYGHEAGDRLLINFADCLRNFGRLEDKRYRFGGDEFALLFSALSHAQMETMRLRARILMEQIQETGFPEAGASLGFASLSEVAGNEENWLKLADERMYADKAINKKARKN